MHGGTQAHHELYWRGSIFQKFFKGVVSFLLFSFTYQMVLLTASRGLCSDSFTVFLHSVFKVMPWEQSCSFKSWISKFTKIHRHLQHVLKIVIPHQSPGQNYPCKSEVLWFSRSLDNTPSFQPSWEGLHLVHKLLWNPLGYDCPENSVMAMTAGQFATVLCIYVMYIHVYIHDGVILSSALLLTELGNT